MERSSVPPHWRRAHRAWAAHLSDGTPQPVTAAATAAERRRVKKRRRAAPAALPAVVRSHQSHTPVSQSSSRPGGSRCAAMGCPLGRTWALVLLCAAACVRVGAAAGASGVQKCASCKSLLGAVQRRALDGWAREQLLGACAARPEQQVRRARAAAPSCSIRPYVARIAGADAALRAGRRGASAWAQRRRWRSRCARHSQRTRPRPCAARRAAGQPGLGPRPAPGAALRADAPRALQAGVCSSSFLSDLAALVFDAEPSTAEQCASCEAAVRNAAAALSDATTQDTVRAPASALFTSLWEAAPRAARTWLARAADAPTPTQRPPGPRDVLTSLGGHRQRSRGSRHPASPRRSCGRPRTRRAARWARRWRSSAAAPWMRTLPPPSRRR